MFEHRLWNIKSEVVYIFCLKYVQFATFNFLFVVMMTNPNANVSNKANMDFNSSSNDENFHTTNNYLTSFFA